MIYESYIYKDELAKISKMMRKKLTQKRWSEHSLCLFEKDVFFSFFIIRKLLEAKTKLTDNITSQKILLDKHFSTSKSNFTVMDNHNFYKYYDFTTKHSVNKSLKDLCDLIIHSYVLYPDFEEINNKPVLAGIIFNSFNEREKCVYTIALTKIIELTETISQNYPSQQILTYNKSNADYDIISK